MITDARIAEWTQAITQVTEEYRAVYGTLPLEALNWLPSPEQWSMGQILHHLITLNQSYFEVLGQVQAGTYRPPFLAQLPFLPGVLGKFLLKAVSPQTHKKTQTPRRWEPATSYFSAELLPLFFTHQNTFLRWAQESASLEHLSPVISSPLHRSIVLPLDAIFPILLAHEKRHLLQAQEVKATWYKFQQMEQAQ